MNHQPGNNHLLGSHRAALHGACSRGPMLSLCSVTGLLCLA